MPMQGVVGGVQVEHDSLGRPRVSLQEEGDEQALDRPRVVADPVVAVERRGRRMLQPVQGALASERGTVGAPRLQLAGQGRQHRIVTQLVVVDQVLVAQRDADNPLHEHGLDAVLDQLRHAPIAEVARQPPHQTDRLVRGPEQQRSGVRGDLPTVERSHHLASFDSFISKQIAATLCRHRGTPLDCRNALSQKSYRRSRAPMHVLV